MNEKPSGSHEIQPRLIALLDGRVVGAVHDDSRSRLRFVYEESWQLSENAYPLSLSMPLTAREHRHPAVEAYLWGLLPDNERTLSQYARTFGVSARNPVALLANLGADCAGAVQFVPPDRVAELEGRDTEIQIDWIDEEEIERELRSAKETGVPGQDRRTAGRFSLAGAQPKVAFLYKDGAWGRPQGRTPTTHILKPPSNEYAGFAENEHLCLDLASELGLNAASSTVRTFGNEIAIVVERFDRLAVNGGYRRIHQEDACQALSVLPWNKYESDGGPGVPAIVALIQESSLEPEKDTASFIDAVILNWVVAATDAHAKNYAFVHLPGAGVRLAPFYDIASYLPYADRRLHEITLAMRVGKEYLVRRVALDDWKALASSSRLTEDYVLSRIERLLPLIPAATEAIARRAISQGLSNKLVTPLTERIAERSRECIERVALGKSVT